MKTSRIVFLVLAVIVVGATVLALTTSSTYPVVVFFASNVALCAIWARSKGRGIGWGVFGLLGQFGWPIMWGLKSRPMAETKLPDRLEALKSEIQREMQSRPVIR